MQWLLTASASIALALLSFSAFVHNDLSQEQSHNRFVTLLTSGYSWLVNTIGWTPTAVFFALCAIAIPAITGWNRNRKTQAM